MSESTYRVCGETDPGGKTLYYVLTGDGDREYIVSKFTHSYELADRWCCGLRRAAQVEEDRKLAVKGRR
jgi:hypothetical protein